MSRSWLPRCCITALALIILFVDSSCRPTSQLSCHCLNGQPCNPFNGFCTAGCKKDWYGPGCQIGNLALGKSAAQSSTYSDSGLLNGAEQAVDGQTPPADSQSSAFCSHTLPKSTGRQWWYVSLSDSQELFVIHTVTIINRRGPKADRLQRFIILYANDTTDPPNPVSWKVCEYQATQPNTVSTYSCQGFTVGMKVAVYLDSGTPDNILTLCEVSIYGYKYLECPSGYAGPGCLLYDCTSDACQNSAGSSCSKFGSCQFKICPDNRYAPPDCLNTLPKVTNTAWQVTATCDQLRVFTSRMSIQGDLAATSLLITAYARDDLQIFRHRWETADSSVFDARVAVSARRAYSLWATPEVCSKAMTCWNEPLSVCSSSNCFLGSSTHISDVEMNPRHYDIQDNGTCIFMSTRPSALTCDRPVSLEMHCGNITAEGERGPKNETVLCGFTQGVEYQCTILAILSNGLTDTYNTKVLIHDVRLIGTVQLVAAGGTVGGVIATGTVVSAVLRCLIRKKLLFLKSKLTGLKLPSKKSIGRITQRLRKKRDFLKGSDTNDRSDVKVNDPNQMETLMPDHTKPNKKEPAWDEITPVHDSSTANNLSSNLTGKYSQDQPSREGTVAVLGTRSKVLLQKLNPSKKLSSSITMHLGEFLSSKGADVSHGKYPVHKATNNFRNILS